MSLLQKIFGGTVVTTASPANFASVPAESPRDERFPFFGRVRRSECNRPDAEDLFLQTNEEARAYTLSAYSRTPTAKSEGCTIPVAAIRLRYGRKHNGFRHNPTKAHNSIRGLAR